jgi:hypothetical protein
LAEFAKRSDDEFGPGIDVRGVFDSEGDVSPGVAREGRDGFKDVLNFETAFGGPGAAADGAEPITAVDRGIMGCAAGSADVAPVGMC